MDLKYKIQYGNSNGNKKDKYCKLKSKIDKYKNYEVFECEEVVNIDINNLLEIKKILMKNQQNIKNQ